MVPRCGLPIECFIFGGAVFLVFGKLQGHIFK